MGGLPFALLLVEAMLQLNYKMYAFTYFYATFLKKRLSPLFIGVLAIKEGNKCKCKWMIPLKRRQFP